MKTALALAALLALAASFHPASAQSVSFAVDVPTAIGGTDWLPNQVLRFDRWTYAVSGAATLPGDFPIGALQKVDGDAYLVVPAEPVQVPNMLLGPADILRWDGTTFTLWQSASDLGLPEDARIDALYVGPDNVPVLSFDAELTLRGRSIGRSDVVAFDGDAWQVLLAGDLAGIPSYANVTGVDRTPSGALALSFDVPTTIGGTTYLPGDVARWTGSGFAPYTRVTGFPISSEWRDFTFAAPPATVTTTPGFLTVTKQGADVRLAWSAFCASDAADFAVYEGALGAGFANHVPRTCSTGGAIATVIAPGAGNRYWLVSAIAGGHEGSLGRGSDGREIAAGPAACLEKAIGACAGVP